MKSPHLIGLPTRFVVLCALAFSLGFPSVSFAKDPKKAPSSIVDFPHFVLEHDDLRLLVVDPLSADGYYQGQRFAHSGLVAQAYWRGTPIFAEFTGSKAPTAHDHVGGTAEEFDIDGPATFPVEAGDAAFLKIGVGLLRRRADGLDKPYSFGASYDWVKKPERAVEHPDSRQIVFTETLDDSATGLGYALTSIVAIREDGSGFDVTRKLTNLGREPLSTEHYSHNFIRVAELPIGSAYHLDWSAPLPWTKVSGEKNGLVVETDGLVFDRERMEKGIYLSTDAELNLNEKIQFTLTVKEAGLRLRIEPDRAVARVAIWGQPMVISPEPFVRIVAAPGETQEWTTRYSIEAVAAAPE